MSLYKERIDSYIDSKKDQMLSDLAALVRIDSQRGPALEGKPFGEGPVAVLLAAQKLMEDYGLAVRNYDNYVVAGDLAASKDEPASDLAADKDEPVSGLAAGGDELADGLAASGDEPAGGLAAGGDEPVSDLAANGDGMTSEKGLDILAHLDVVPVTEDWTVTQPFEPKLVDGRIYGRGTADDKGPAIAALYAIRAIHDLEIPMKKGVRLVLGSDEECGSGDLRYYYGIEKEAPYTFTPDADFPVINIEKGRLEADFTAEPSGAPSAEISDGQNLPGADSTVDGQTAEHAGETRQRPRVLSLKSGEKANVVPGRAVLVLEGLPEAAVRAAAGETEKETGVLFEITEDLTAAANILRVEARGLSAHASTPQEGHNALTASIRLVAKLSGYLAHSEMLRALLALDQLFPYEDTCGEALGIYREEGQSGAVTMCLSILDYTPERMKGTFDSRLPIGCTEENTKQPIMEQLAKYGIRLEDTPMTKPHCVPGDSDFVKILLDSYELYTGIKGAPLSTGGGTYVHNLERGVAFGCMTPDVDNHMHGDDEFMVIDTLVTSAKIFAEAIIRICNEL